MNEAAEKVIDTSAEHFGVGGKIEGPLVRVAGTVRPEDQLNTNAELKPARTFYRDNALDGFRYGAAFDYRVRLATEMLTHNAGMVTLLAPGSQPEDVALYALDVASELVRLAEERGLVETFTDPKQEAWLRSHVARQVAYQIEQVKEGKRQQEESGRIHTAVHKAFNQ